MVKIASIYSPVLEVMIARSSVTEPQNPTALQSGLLRQRNGLASAGSLFPIWLLTQNVFPGWTQAVGVGSAQAAWPVHGPLLKLAPTGPMQFSLFASQSLIEGHGNRLVYLVPRSTGSGLPFLKSFSSKI